MPARVLLIEDSAETARLLAGALGAGSDPFEVTAAGSARDGLEQLARSQVDCVLLDYRLPDADGLECLRKIRQRDPDLPVIVITGAGSEEVAVEAMKLGASDYLVKHGKYLVTVPVVVREALGRRELARTAARYRSALRSSRREASRLRRELRERYRLDGIIGESVAIEHALCLAGQAARGRRCRPDLYYRLRVFPSRRPALRERRADIRRLALHLLERISAQEAKKLRGFDPRALRLLERYPWPGNVRELENEIHRLVLCAEAGERITPDLLAAWIVEGAPPAAGGGARPLKESVREVELATIRARLREHGYHRAATARSLGMTRESLWAKLRQLGFVAPRRGSGDD